MSTTIIEKTVLSSFQRQYFGNWNTGWGVIQWFGI